MHGVLDFLTGSDPSAITLRSKLDFRIVPMLNPDGVIVGNSRTDGCGDDINRRWSNPSRSSHPTVYAVQLSPALFVRCLRKCST